MHWANRYVGKPYAEADCAELAMLVRENQFDHAVSLPTEREPSPFALSSLISRNQQDYAERVEQPHEGDAVMMRSRGRLNHIGIYCELGGQGYVLHALKNAGQACLHRLDDIERHNLQIEGFYRWL